MNVIKLAAGLAWAGLAVSTAAPASAKAWTSQTGTYANCSAGYSSSGFEFEACAYMLPYRQTIKFVNVGCNQGCSSLTSLTYTDLIYGAGRKVATLIQLCENGTNLYNLGACSC